ncbi:MAG: hypothetical protein K6G22_05015 [Lachnospiraceae bacterium]|nr:hypothetical protein [Lachnospiraceae bacterium]
MKEDKKLLNENLEMVSGGTGEDAEGGIFGPTDYHPEYGHVCRNCHYEWSSSIKDERMCSKCHSHEIDTFQIK